MVRIDAHCHFWELGRGDYAWLDATDPKLAPIARDFRPSDLAPLLEATGVDKIVVVQAAASEAETDYLLNLADRHDEIAGVVGWADLQSDKALQRLHGWSNNPKFKGIRPMLQDIEDTQWLLESPRADIFSALVRLGFRFDALVQPRHLPVILKFCGLHPELSVVIDHAAKPKEALAGDNEAFTYWSTHMKSLAQNTNAYCKLSGLLTEFEPENFEHSQTLLQRYLDVLLESFGPNRLMWGSDWPVVTLTSKYQDWHSLSKNLLGQIGPTARNKIFGDTANRFYGLGAT